MKTDTILILGAAAAGLFLVYKMTRTGTAKSGTKDNLNNYGTLAIPNTALPGQAGWAWENFTDGTSIAPNGDYYMNGVLVWKAQP